MANQQLIDYIKQQQSQGLGDEQIKQSLLANNWQMNDIEEAFNFVKTPFTEQSSIIFSEVRLKNKRWKILGISVILVIFIITGIVGFFIWHNINKKEADLQIQQAKVKAENLAKANEENPEDIAKRLIMASFSNNDKEFVNERSYCDSSCQQNIKENLSMTFEEYLDWSWKIGALERKMIVNKLETKVKNKTENEADIEYTINYSDVDDNDHVMPIRGSATNTIDFKLIKVDNKWMTDETEVLNYSIPLTKNYQKLFSDLEKCYQMQSVEFNIPTNGGTFSIDDTNNPLYGFSIRFPKLKESMKVSVSCSEFPLTTVGTFYVSLPISIKADKDFLEVVADKKYLPIIGPLPISKVEADKTYGGKFPLIKIPYNNTAIDEKSDSNDSLPSSFIDASFDGKSFGDSDVYFAELDPNKHIATGFFSVLYNTWVVLGQMQI